METAYRGAFEELQRLAASRAGASGGALSNQDPFFYPAAFGMIFEPREFWEQHLGRSPPAGEPGSNPTLIMQSPRVTLRKLCGLVIEVGVIRPALSCEGPV